MQAFSAVLLLTAVLPALLMLTATASIDATGSKADVARWRRFYWLSGMAVACSVAAVALRLAATHPGAASAGTPSWLGLTATPVAAWIALLVQLLGAVIGAFSSRYLEGETGQPRFIASLSGVLAAVHLLLLADHWVVLIVSWAIVGLALQRLLCFYQERPFAMLAAHKKQLADRLADLLLLVAAGLAWREVGSGAFPDLWRHLATHGASATLQASAVLLALAVLLRAAQLPVHGWLIQVMEAPTPVSALMHAGVVNLGGFVLIRFAPLLEASPVARWLLVGVGLATAVLAGFVMLTRISIKVRLAWSTVAQMGFMVLECGLGLYTLAVLHLVGHSLYKAHAFLSSSGAVRDTRLRQMRGASTPSSSAVLVAPAVAAAVIAAMIWSTGFMAWPWWWVGVLALAWAPLLWQPEHRAAGSPGLAWHALAGIAAVTALTAAAMVGHHVPLGLADMPKGDAGWLTFLAMAGMYLCIAGLQARPHAFASWRRWSYAGFYLDEFYTRAALYLWPTRWTSRASAVPSTVADRPVALPASD